MFEGKGVGGKSSNQTRHTNLPTKPKSISALMDSEGNNSDGEEIRVAVTMQDYRIGAGVKPATPLRPLQVMRYPFSVYLGPVFSGPG